MLRIDNVNIKRKKIILQQNCIEFNNQQINIIKGKNGTGKTTFLENLYFGHLDLSINGEKIIIPANYISFLSQKDYMIKNFTIQEIIKTMQLENTCVDLLDYYNLSQESIYHTLSGGEKQKIRIMVALYANKDIIILDEPFNNLDKTTIMYLISLIDQMKHKTFIIVNHNPEFHFANEALYELENSQLIYQQIAQDKISAPKYIHTQKLSYLFYKDKLFLAIATIAIIIGTFILLNNIKFDQPQYFTSDKSVIYSSSSMQNNQVIPLNTNEQTPISLEDNNIFVYPMLNPQAVASNLLLPINTYNIQTINYGTYPSDNTNEILIDINLANKLAPQTKYHDLIGQSFTYNAQKYVISGIYEPIDEDISIIYHAYSTTPIITDTYFCIDTKLCGDISATTNKIYNDKTVVNNKITYLTIGIVSVIVTSTFILLINMYLSKTKKYRVFCQFYSFPKIKLWFEMSIITIFTISIVLILISLI